VPVVDAPVTTAPQDNPPPMLYGVYWMHECFCLLDEQEARSRAAEVAAIRAAATLGELRAPAPTLRYTQLPADLDELEDDPDTTLWDWQEDGLGVSSGDWPGMPTAYALGDSVDRSLIRDVIKATGAERVATSHTGEYLNIPVDKENELVAALARRGVKAVRDDAVIDALGLN